MSNVNYGLVGTGGYAREVMPLLLHQVRRTNPSASNVRFFFVDKSGHTGDIGGIAVVSEDEFCQQDGAKYFNIAVADSKLREAIALRLEHKGCAPLAIWADNAIQIGSNQIAASCIVSPFCCITADAKIGRYFHCNIYSYVAHDCVVGDFVTFAPNVNCNGNVIVEDHAYIGTGAIIKQGNSGSPLVIGRGAIVGMGAVVTKSVAAGAVVVGNPASPLKQR